MNEVLFLKVENLIKNETNCIINSINNNFLVSSEFFDNLIILDEIPNQILGKGNKLVGKHGIYIFIYKDNLKFDYETIFKFNESARGAKFKKYQDYNIKKGQVCYLGSAKSISLYRRIRMHYIDDSNYDSLKLSNPNRIFLKSHLKVYAFTLNTKYDKYKDIILPMIEKNLHQIFNPTNGSPI